MLGHRLMGAGVAVCWLLLATAGQRLPWRAFLLLLGATMVVTTYVALRGPAWFEAYRIGRQVEQSHRARRGAVTSQDPLAQVQPK